MSKPVHQPGKSRLSPGKVCRVALLGFGTVGSAVVRLLYARHDEHQLQLSHILARNPQRKKVDWVPDTVCWTDNFDEVLGSDVEVIVELVGGLNPAHDWVSRALKSGKSVVTANKQLIAHHGTELIEVARAQHKHLTFGACVAGGVPVLAGLHEGLAGDRLVKVCGILNGTCNYILTRIEQSGITFAEAVKEAQAAGFAEADPSEDVDGLDAGAKLVVLARVGLNAEVTPKQVLCRTIRELDHVDFEYARDLGCTIRQISRAELRNEKVFASVEPALVPQNSRLASASGSHNLVVSTGEFGGDTVFAGHGAGGNPTAVAVVSDLLYIVRHRSAGVAELDRPAAATYEVSHDFETPHYLRFVVKDEPGIIAGLAGVLSRHHINIDAVFQRPGHEQATLPFVITLESCTTRRAEAALAEMNKFSFLVQPPLRMAILR
jgi:homoserine dehydrogenase